MESTKNEKERLAQKCHDLEMQLNLMKEEKSNLSGAFCVLFDHLFSIKDPDYVLQAPICPISLHLLLK